MRVFQFYFNPKVKEDLIFESFCYDPKNIYEKKLGSLYLVGLLKNALPQNYNFLERIASFAREAFYKKINLKPERAFQKTLEEMNKFLEEITKDGDVSWLGNLSLSLLNINIKDFNLNFSKAGEIKVYLIRGKKLVDIDKKLKFKDIDSLPLKLFTNVITGKLIEDDLLLVTTKEVFDFFEKENIIQKLRTLGYFSEKEFKKILDEKEEILSQVRGIAFFVSLSKEVSKEKKEIIAPKVLKEFSLIEIFSPFLTAENEKLKPFSFSTVFSPLGKIVWEILKNPKMILLVLFILILMIGYLLFH